MTRPPVLDTDDLDAFTHALPPTLRRQLRGNYAVLATLPDALALGWRPLRLAREISAGRPAPSVAVAVARLQRAATTPPPGTPAPKLAQCPHPGRWIEDPETGAPLRRCECP